MPHPDDKSDMTYPIHIACTSGCVQIVAVLILNGANPWILNEEMRTPKSVATKEGNVPPTQPQPTPSSSF